MDTPNKSDVIAQPRMDFGPDAPLGQMTWKARADGEDYFINCIINDAANTCPSNEQAAAARAQASMMARNTMRHGTQRFAQFSQGTYGQLITISLSLRCAAIANGQPTKDELHWRKTAGDLLDKMGDQVKVADIVDWFWKQGEHFPK